MVDKGKVILGADRGKVSSILAFDKKAAFVKGCNIKHRYISKYSQEEGKNIIVERVSESPITLCKLMLCDSEGIASKIRWNLNNGKSGRVSKRTGKEI